MIYAPHDVVGPYRISRLLGRGGMGEVYLADDTRLLRPVALKVLTGVEQRAELLREARLAARLHHPNIAVLYDVVEANARLHIAMEYLDGASLASVLEAGGGLALGRVHSLMAQVLRGVGHAHAAGVVHCDLKPANIVVLPGDDVKVLDFGLARLEVSSTHSQSTFRLAGTPGYVAPERLRGAPPTHQGDIFSLGVVLQDMLRVASTSSGAADERRTAADPQAATLAAIAAKATAVEPAARFPSAAAMLEAIEAPHVVAGSTRPWKAWTALAAAAATTWALVWWQSAIERPPQADAVVGITLGAAGADPLAVHLAAALEQLLRGSLRGGTMAVVTGPDDGAPAGEARFRISGTVSRIDERIELQLGVTSPAGRALSTAIVRGRLDELPALGTALARGVDDVVRRAGLAGPAAALDAEEVRRLLTVDPQAFEDYAQAREYMRTSDIEGGLDHAVRFLERAVATDNQFALAHAALAEAYWQKYQATRVEAWTNKARAAALDAIRLSPNDAAVRYTLALIYRGTGRLDDAMQEVTQAIALNPANDSAYALRGRLEADRGQVDRALADLRLASRLRPAQWEHQRLAGLILYSAGRFGEAIEQFARVVALRPTNASAHQALGTAYHAAGRIDDAVASYERALAISPSANTYANLAKIHYDAGRYDRALAAYTESARIQPKEPLTFRNLGDTYRRLGDTRSARQAYGAAITLAGEALAVNPANLEALSLQALCHAKLGHTADAVTLARRVVTAASLTPTVRYRAGVALVLVHDDDGVAQVARALDDGFSRSVAGLDEDLAAVVRDARLASRLQGTSSRQP